MKKYETVTIDRFNGREVRFPTRRKNIYTALAAVQKSERSNSINIDVLLIDGIRHEVRFEKRYGYTVAHIMLKGNDVEKVTI